MTSTAHAPRTLPSRTSAILKVIQHPIRVRVLGLLRTEGPRTQRELGRTLSLSNAAIHYHLKILQEAGLVYLAETRPGPNRITEKLYAADEAQWAEIVEATRQGNADLDFFLNYTVSWIQERNREGVELLRRDQYACPFVAGSYVVKASPARILELQRRLQHFVEAFVEEHNVPDDSGQAHTVTLSVLPSRTEPGAQANNVLTYEPEVPSAARQGELREGTVSAGRAAAKEN